MSRLRPYWIVGVVIALLGTVAIGFALTSPAFRLKKLSISGLARVSRGDVLARAAIDPSANVWLLNKRAIEARIEAIPYVGTAAVKRIPVADVSIAIVERVPAACVRDAAGREVTIDRENRVLQDDCAEDLVAYALRSTVDDRPGAFLHDAELSELEGDDGTLSVQTQKFSAFSHDRFGQLVAMMPGGISVQFGDDGDLAGKERLIGPILTQLGPRAASVKSVDLRAPATPVVEYRAPVIRRHPQHVDTQ